MRQFLAIIVALAVIASIAVGTSYWLNKEKQRQDSIEEIHDLSEVEELLAEDSRPSALKALEIINEHKKRILESSALGKKWTEFFLTACIQTEDYGHLLELYKFSPKIFAGHEEAILMVASAYIALREPEKYQQLRTLWETRTLHPDEWFLLDAGKLVIEGKYEEAEKLLKSKTLSNDAETGRLVRLAMFHLKEDPSTSWNYLSQACSHDPTNPEIHSLRAQFLENFGKKELALVEYLAAITQDPEDAILRDQLAEFYRRNDQYALALHTWSEALTLPSSDIIWIKAWFWSRMVHPIDFDWKASECPEGRFKPLVDILTRLEAGEYWKEKSLEGSHDLAKFLHAEQLTFWLRLVQYFKDGNEENAFELLNASTFSAQSWHPDLEIALKRILHYRQRGTFSFPNAVTTSEKKHTLFKILDSLAAAESSGASVKIPVDFRELLYSEEVFAAAFAAAEWWEAALQLHRLPVIPKVIPGWVAYDIAQALRNNRSRLETLDFTSKQNLTPPLQLLMGELLIADGSPEAAIDKLRPLSEDDSLIGYRASWLLSLLYIENEEFERAKEMIENHPHLSTSVLGQETLARIALSQGDESLANKIYTTLEYQSSEAMSYLARRAFIEKNWKRARELTEKLLRKHPSNLLLRKNLKLIIEQQGNHEE